ncbi:hypothetical protein LSUE1_G000989 [Lachnellula suecica]|uniref:Zn(2)-C6 fungal-type domain-containing protein n=1 Tax=Lachnellula suecica TaxID=602035 RepID=A0A8T9CNS2_9HELO|nr:hypothetical protein LSUE1_G000989 [Lachnellula suecica]
MDVGPPDQKRPRLTGPAHEQWQSPTGQRTLPPVPSAAPYQQHPFSRPSEPPHLLDRRPSTHTEPTQYDQESRRPNSGPSHVYHHPNPPPAFGPPREAMVKRDPSDEPHPPHYRPSSTGTTADHNVNAPPPHHDAPVRYLPPFEPPHRAPYPTSYAPPQSPMSATEYHPPYSGAGAPRDSFSSVTYPTNNQTQKVRKAQRAAQACDSCRTLKAKCDEGRPSCSTCREKGQECRYRDPPPKQQDKTTTDIMESLIRIEQSVSAMQTEMSTYSAQVKQIKEVQAKYEPRRLSESRFKQEAQEYVPDSNSSRLEYPAQLSSLPESHPLPSTESSVTPGQPQPPHTMEQIRYPDEEEEEEEAGGDPGPQKPPSIPVNHTTGAARLLLTRPISAIVEPIMLKHRIKNEKYPIVQEEKRGLLRLYGRGEGTDAPPGYDRDPLVDHGSDSTSGDTNSDVSSPAGDADTWGQVGGLTPPGNPPPEWVRGGINSEGMPDFSRDVVLRLVHSFKTNVNNMHPLLIPKQLDRLVEIFLKSIPDSQVKPKQVSALQQGYQTHAPVAAGFVRNNPESPGNKRKRSPGLGAEYPSEIQRDWDLKSGHPFRTISSALVLCVLALGAICEHKGKIPNLAPDRERDEDITWSASPTIRNGHPPSPMHSSPSISTPMGIQSPQENDRGQPRSRRTSVEGTFATRGNATKPRNLDVIPGLAYFVYVTDIIGNQLGGNSLQHVHCNILAGLYHGQLARVMESHSYIHQACRGLQVILRPKMDRFKRLKEEGKVGSTKDTPLITAFWTCLQLESDIVAELPCPHSGILTYEEDMPGLDLAAASSIYGFDPLVMESYAAQLFLRKHLNQLHNMFYTPTPDSRSHLVQSAGHFRTLEACDDNLQHVPIYAPHMVFKDDDEPAKNILDARLRAKYFGAKVITYRSFVLKILEYSATKGSKPAGEQMSADFKPGIDVPNIDEGIAPRPESWSKMLQYAENCIKALFQSTSAFYGLGDPSKVRLMVTNIWGTAHAQWGNLLTLGAAYNDPNLNKFVDEGQLRVLFKNTLGLLKLYATPSSALNTDYLLLQYMGEYLKLVDPEPNASTSFSSTSGDMPMSGGH